MSVAVEGLFAALAAELRPTVRLVGFLDEERENRHPICVEPGGKEKGTFLIVAFRGKEKGTFLIVAFRRAKRVNPGRERFTRAAEKGSGVIER